MPIKRRTPKRAPHAVTPEAIAAYRAGDETALHRALGLKPWHASPLEATGDCTHPEGTAAASTWAMNREIREELEAASCQ